MPTATKFSPSKVPGEDPAPIVDITAHEADMRRRQAERDAHRDELRRCLNPAYATKLELAKPFYRWTVSAEWMGTDEGKHAILKSEQTVAAQDENSAWAAFCDKIGTWPSRRNCELSIKRGKQVDADVVAAHMANAENEGELPTVVVGPVGKFKKQ